MDFLNDSPYGLGGEGEREGEGERSAGKGGVDVICSEAKLNNPRNTLLDKSLPVREGRRRDEEEC
jgi:hypothetical protein